MKHALERTSPKGPGQRFIGRCINCGKTELTLEDFHRDECENVVGRTQEETLLEAISPSSPEGEANDPR